MGIVDWRDDSSREISPFSTPSLKAYQYDPLNRIKRIEEGIQSRDFDYDRFGNMWVPNASSGFARDSFTPATSAWFDANNRLTNPTLGVQHDAAENLTAMGGFTYEYDAEGMMNKATPGVGSGTVYRYDGEGRRVQKQTGTGPVTTFVYNAFGELAAEYTSGGIPAGQPTGTHYLMADHLGSTRLVMDASGNVVSRHDYLPFGEEINANVSGRTTAMKYVLNDDLTQRFTGKERDSETGLDYFGARYLSGAMGRFTSPDNQKFSEKTDPQSWNLYLYTGNNPLNRIDPTGENWFQVNGNWEWHDGDEYTYKDKNGKEHTLKSQYTHLLTFEKTNRKAADGATIGVLTLRGEGGKVLGSTEAYSGSSKYNFMTTPNGLYEINLNRRGGLDTNAIAFGADGPQLAAFRNGIQEVGLVRARGEVWDPRDDWGTLRANLARPSGAGTAFYLHGKNLYFTEGRTYTHGCITEPRQSVLRQIFKLDPSGVGEGAKNGRIAVWVGKR